MNTTKWGLLSTVMTTVMVTMTLPVMAQRATAQRVCIESEATGRIVCGRVINDSRYENDRYGNRDDNRYDDRNDSRYGNRYDDRTSNRSSDAPADFDTQFYVTAYPDVAAAIAQGRIKSAYAHYRNFGRFEGRFPRFNEASYLSKNPDIAAAVRARKIRSAYDHWLKFGRFEKRPL